jgi:hypothetical protein
MKTTPNQITHLLEKKYLSLKDLEPFPDLISVGEHLQITNARQILFHFVNNIDTIPVCKCTNPLEWNTDARKYRDFCSKKCTALYTAEKRKSTSVKKYGVDHYSKTAEFNKKILDTSKKRYGVEHYSKSGKFLDSIKKTNLEKFGVEFASQSPEIKKKSREKFQENYGVDNPAKSKIIQDKIADTNLKKYGVAVVFKSEEIQKKIKKTNLERYGTENARKNPEISSKISSTRKENYYPAEVLDLLKNPAWLEQQNVEGKSVGEIATDLGVSSSNLSKYFGKYSIDIARHWSSSHESKILKVLDEHQIHYKKNYRKLIPPYEIDIFIPSLNLAIEINGGFWHHEDAGKDKFYHLTKYNRCRELGIELWNIFDWEVDHKLDIISSKIFHKLFLSKKISARSLEIVPVSDREKTIFLEQNHIQGNCLSKINIGLYKDNVLFALMTLGKSRFNKKHSWELLRYCTKQGYSVTGGAGKLLNFFIKNHLDHEETLISYCNLRFSSGNLYKKLNFKQMSQSPPNYFYVTKSGKYAGSRNQWQKHMLKNKLRMFDPNLSELENMKLNGYHRIWDCGNLVFVFGEN